MILVGSGMMCEGHIQDSKLDVGLFLSCQHYMYSSSHRASTLWYCTGLAQGTTNNPIGYRQP